MRYIVSRRGDSVVVTCVRVNYRCRYDESILPDDTFPGLTKVGDVADIGPDHREYARLRAAAPDVSGIDQRIVDFADGLTVAIVEAIRSESLSYRREGLRVPNIGNLLRERLVESLRIARL